MSRQPWITIGHLVGSDRLPAPISVTAYRDRITIELPSPPDVDRWVQHLGLPPGNIRPGARYGSADFLSEPGWCGFTTVSISCPAPVVIA